MIPEFSPEIEAATARIRAWHREQVLMSIEGPAKHVPITKREPIIEPAGKLRRVSKRLVAHPRPAVEAGPAKKRPAVTRIATPERTTYGRMLNVTPEAIKTRLGRNMKISAIAKEFGCHVSLVHRRLLEVDGPATEQEMQCPACDRFPRPGG